MHITAPIDGHWGRWSAWSTCSKTPGSYLYVEASSPAQEGDQARLLSEQFTATQGRCLSFWYHMYGSSTGTLNVLILDKDGTSNLAWSKSGDQGDQWREAKLTLESKVEFKVR